ncbi:MAG: M20/M25/M40 family metallo-hydrolase [bacterium]
METIYKYLHENPECSGKEHKTNKYVLEILEKYNPKIFKIKLSIVAFFNMQQSETLAFRSELDALPISEDISHKICSKNDSMHACGHDIHTSALLQLCEHIKSNKFNHNIALIFQSKEETGLGSKDIIKSKLFKKLKITKVIGMHVWPNLEFDKIYSNKNLMFGSYELDINIWGKPNHVSTYSNKTDATFASYLIYKKLLKFKKNKIAHLGKIQSGIIRNISSDHATLYYSVRFKKNKNIEDKIRRMKLNTNCDVDYNFKEYYPPLICSKNLLEIINPQKVKTLKSAEDFGYYKEKAETLYLLYGLGTGYNLHTNKFTTNIEQRKCYYNKLVEVIDKFKI